MYNKKKHVKIHNYCLTAGDNNIATPGTSAGVSVGGSFQKASVFTLSFCIFKEELSQGKSGVKKGLSLYLRQVAHPLLTNDQEYQCSPLGGMPIHGRVTFPPPPHHLIKQGLLASTNCSFANLQMASHHVFQVRQDKLVGFSNLSRHPAKEVAKYVVELLPVLCEHLEATSAFFQVNIFTAHLYDNILTT